MNTIQRRDLLKTKICSIDERKLSLKEEIELCTQKEILLMQEFVNKIDIIRYKKGKVSMSEDLFKALRKALKV